ncbi:MAG: hypothetical protein H6Q89_1369 [Myxococcaceae bacterium]|nr:hypothetical protein [Myxococcaceae bacterium]
MNTRHSSLCCAAVLAFAAGCGEKAPPPPPLEVAKIAVTAPGKAVGPADEKLIPVTGGTLVSADQRLTIDVPAGALATAQKITIQPISNGTPGGKGLAYRIGPEGQTFTAPVKLTFRYSGTDLAGSEALALKIAYQDKEGRWNTIKSVVRDETAKTVTVETTHFSDWSLLGGWQLMPPFASVGAGKAVDLTVVTCNSKGTGSDELAELVYTCVPEPDFFTVEDWAVNGTPGGTVALGQVASSRVGTARYSAPNSQPQSNPVGVEAIAKDKSGRKTLLISSIWVDAHPPMAGIINTTQVNQLNAGDVLTTSANVTFKYDVGEGMYRVTAGTVNSRLDVVSNGCEQHTSFSGAIAAQDGTIAIGEGTYYAQGNTMGNFSGTTNCTSNNVTEPLTIYSAAYWWPAPMTMELAIKPDGRIEDTLVDVKQQGRVVTATWSLVPVK